MRLLLLNKCLIAGGMAIGLTLGVPMIASAAEVYIPTGDENRVLVVDGDTDRVVGSISGVDNSHGLAGNQITRTLLAGSLNVRAPGEAPSRPEGMSVDEHESHHARSAVGVTPSAPEGAQTAGTVYQLDPESRRVSRKFTVPGAVHHTLITPDGRYGIATHPVTGGISVVDMVSGAVVKFIATGPVANYAVADGERIWVSNSGNNTISEIDVDSWSVVRNIMVDQAPEHMILSPDNSNLYVVANGAGMVLEIESKSGTVLRRFPVGQDPHGVDLSDAGDRLFISVKGDDRLAAVDLDTGVVRLLGLAPAPYHLTAVPGTGKLYVSSREQPKVWVVDQSSLELLGEFPIRGVAHQMAVLSAR